MKNLCFTLIYVLCWFVSAQVMAQSRVVKGKITGEDGTGVPGVNVTLKGTTTGTSTNTDGTYMLTVANDAATLVVSYIGYATQELVVGNQSTLDVRLVPDLKGLDEVVVIGTAPPRAGT